MIREYASVFGVDPALVTAVAEAESHFNSRAVSAAGARGIMQIMPATGEWIAARLEVVDYDEGDLFDAELNLRFGTYYLSYLATLFPERWQIVAAYNAGEGVVRGWIADGVDSAHIPYPETLCYVKKIDKLTNRYKTHFFNNSIAVFI